MLELQNKTYGDGTVARASQEKLVIPRLPTGIFMATLATGGGYPVHRVTRLKGLEGSGKSTAAITATKMATEICWRCYNMAEFCTCSLPPIRMNVCYADIEGSLDYEWMQAIGVDLDRVYLPVATDGTDYLDLLKQFCQADDCGLIVIDSISMLLPRDEFDRSIGDKRVASHARLIQDAALKLQQVIWKENRREHPIAIIAINQVRFNVGVMFGSNETESGGQSFKHWFAMGVRLSKLAGGGSDKKEFKDDFLKVAQNHGLRIDKWKMKILAREAQFLRAQEDIFGNDGELKYPKGSIVDEKIIYDYAKTAGLVNNKYCIPGLYENVSLQRELLAEISKRDARYYQLHIEVTKRIREVGRIAGITVPDLPESSRDDEE